MASAQVENWKQAKSICDFIANVVTYNYNISALSLEKYRGHLCILVNIAFECENAKTQFEELGELYEKYSKSRGLRILGFLCNDFGERGFDNMDSSTTFTNRYNISFDIFKRVDVNGNNAHPLWKYLKRKRGDGTPGGSIKGNFTKFIIDKKGQPVARYGPNISPKELLPTLEQYW